MRAAVFAAMFSAAAGFSAVAQADSIQTSDDIIKFYSEAIDLGGTRGICVGTQEKCDADRKAQLAKVPTGLDMLINFNLNSADLTSEARMKLDQFAKALKDNRLSRSSFVIEGHTDASGSETYNEQLSQRRAQSVAAFLLANGVESTRIQALGVGESAPRVPDPYDPVNRRVEMRIKIQ